MSRPLTAKTSKARRSTAAEREHINGWTVRMRRTLLDGGWDNTEGLHTAAAMT